MRTPQVVPGKEFSEAALLLQSIGRRTQVYPLVLHRPPQALHEYVVVATTAPIHADLDAMVQQHPGEFFARELRTLVGIEDFGFAEPGKGFAERLDAEPRRQSVRQSPGQN